MNVMDSVNISTWSIQKFLDNIQCPGTGFLVFLLKKAFFKSNILFLFVREGFSMEVNYESC